MRISPSIRIAFGLALLTVSILLIADLFGLIPNKNIEIIKSRYKMSESLAIQISSAVTTGETKSIGTTLYTIVKRNDDILSAALTKNDGEVIASSGDHDKYWVDNPNNKSTPTHVQISIFDGDTVWANLQISFKPTHDSSNLAIFQNNFFRLIIFIAITCFLGYILYIKRTLKELDPSKVIPERVKATLDSLAEGVLILDENESIILVNSTFINKSLIPENKLIGKKASTLKWSMPSNGNVSSETPWCSAIQSNISIMGTPMILETSSGEVAFMVNSSPILDSKGRVKGSMATFDDVTELEKRNEELAKSISLLKSSRDEIRQKNKALEILATTDTLTNFYNRRAFFDKFEISFRESKENDIELSCVMADIDNFKKINDTHGHSKGDDVIKLVSDIIRNSVRSSDYVGRYGGEEFCIILPDTSIENAATHMDNIRKSIEEQKSIDLNITVSFGVSSIQGGAKTTGDLINQADEMLYLSKERGRNCVSSWASRDQLATLGNNKNAPVINNVIKLNEISQPAEKVITDISKPKSFTHKDIRKSLQQQINTAISLSRSNNTISAILLIGLDRFRRVNETLGHEVGDTLLQSISKRLLSNTRNTDRIVSVNGNDGDQTISKLTGDEFAIVLSDIKSHDDLHRILERTLNLISRPIKINSHELLITCSIGCSVFPNDSNDADKLLKYSTTSLSHAKGKGGNCYILYNKSIDNNSANQLVLESHMAKALERDEFVVHYQPKVNIKTNAITSMEALIRWNHPDIGMISPNIFIPLAEKNGLISSIGNWVMKQAFIQAIEWRKQGASDITISVNIASRQLLVGDLYKEITTMSNELGASPDMIELEITESSIMRDISKAVDTMNKLSEAGYRISIDDFGSGHSSLNYIRKFPINTIKIDRSFIFDLNVSKQDRFIVAAIVNMAKTLDLKVIAEGVENEEQRQYLLDIGCNEIQGFLVSRPLSADKATNILLSDKILNQDGADNTIMKNDSNICTTNDYLKQS